MDMQNHRIAKIISVIMLFLAVSLASADDDILRISAGEDQIVNAGDMVELSGVITFEDDDEYTHKYHKQAKYKRHRLSKHKRHLYKYAYKKHYRYDDDEDDDDDESDDEDIVINWTQDAGPIADLINPDTLNPQFIAPTPANTGDMLVFTLTVSDDDGELIASDSVKVNVLLPEATVSGRVTSIDGTERSGISINVLSSGTSLTSTTSDLNGGFSVDLAANSDFVLVLTADDYADQVVPVKTPESDGSIFLDITMIVRGRMETFSADTDATFSGADGASVSVTAGSFVDENGAAITGNIDLTITPVDISRPAALAAFPGEFSGVLEGSGDDSPIISFGAVEFEFTQNGQPVQLAQGQTANILIPIYIDTFQDGMLISVGDSIPLWALNEATGIWEQEGTGIVVASSESPTGLALEATVSHFSWWNCDVSMNAAQAIVTVLGEGLGTALVKARTNADIGWRPNTVETVTSVGTPTPPLFIPSNSEVCFWAEINFDNGSTGSTPESCLTAEPDSVVEVVLNSENDDLLNIITIPAATVDELDAIGFLGFPVVRVQLLPSSYETAVSYSITSGSLPAGLSLSAVNAVRAEIAGVASETGSFSTVIEAVDSDGNTDSVTINYNVTTDIVPPIIEESIDIRYTMLTNTVDMNVYRVGGGPVTMWELSYDEALEQSPPPAGLSLDPVTGILAITEDCIFWEGILRASNSSGTAEASIRISDFSCES